MIFPQEPVPVPPPEPIGKETALQMIDLMLKYLGQQPVGRERHRDPLPIEPRDGHLRTARDLRRNPWKRKAPFRGTSPPLTLEDSGIDKNEFPSLFSIGAGHKDMKRRFHLIRCKPHPICHVHRLNHGLNEILNVRGNLPNGDPLSVQHRVRFLNDGKDHGLTYRGSTLMATRQLRGGRQLVKTAERDSLKGSSVGDFKRICHRKYLRSR